MPPDCLHPADRAAANNSAANNSRTGNSRTGHGSAAGMPADSFPRWAEEPPVPPEGSLVPGSRFHEDQWIMAAEMLARGASFLQAARAMGCSRTTLWRAYYGSQPFRVRVWWERQALNREAQLRLASLRALVTEQVERLVSAGDPSTVRWLAERLGMFTASDEPPLPNSPSPILPSPILPSHEPPTHLVQPRSRPASPATSHADAPAGPVDCANDPNGPDDTAGPAPGLAFDDDHVPGALRERMPPDPRAVAAILARPEAEGPKGVYPWTLNPDDPFSNLGSALERRGGQGAFTGAFPRRR